MTSLQIRDAERKEQQRANSEREKENRRSNQAQEREANRSNTEKERETHRSNRANERLKTISTVADILLGAQKNSTDTASKAISALGSAGALAKTLPALLNDPKWYEVSEQITKDVASISAFQPTGTIPALDDAIGYGSDEIANTAFVKDEGHRFAVAGYCHFSYMPTIGKTPYATNNADAVNITAQNIYSYMRNQVSGSVKNYERADYMMYLLAVDAPLSYYSWMKRIYGILNYANLYNKYLPKHILNDMNVDYMDLSNHIANLRGYINQFAVRINATLAIPSRMPYYARHQFLNTYMFSDSRSKKHQLYFFSPRKYFIWKIDPNNQATMLDMEDPWAYNNTASLKLDDIVNFGNYILDTLLEEEDVGLMVGDTVKAFGETELVKVPEIPDGYVVEIGTSDEILDQITNIKFVKKNFIGARVSPRSGGVNVSIVGYDQLDSSVVAKHTYDFTVRQNTSTQEIYQRDSLQVELDFASSPNNVHTIWNAASPILEQGIVCNDTENAVEINFLTDDSTPSRVVTSTRLTPICSFERPVLIRENGNVSEWSVAGRVEACGSEIVLEGYTSVLYWDPVTQSAKVATYELFDGLCSYTSDSDTTNGQYGTGYTGDECFISDFDYHPCINLYRTENSGVHNTAPSQWIRRYAKLWDRNVSTYIPKDTLARIHGAAIMGEFNLAQIGLVPKAKL